MNSIVSEKLDRRWPLYEIKMLFMNSPTADPRPLLATVITLAGQTIAAVRPEQHANPTPCGSYNVHDLLGHLMGAVDRLAVVGRGVENPFAHPEEFFPADGDWVAMWHTFAAEATEAWLDDAALIRPTMLPWAAESGDLALRSYIAEFSVHTWDLATATGQTPEWDADVLAMSVDVMRQILPAVGRREMFDAIRATMPPEMQGEPDPYDAAIEVSDAAPLIDQLVAHVGRTPR
jgi:uncharacterized protein (TIGR03086 family)